MNADITFSNLSPEQVDAIESFEQEFRSKFGSSVYLLAFNRSK